MKKINWGIIGCGRIAGTFATALNGMEDSVLLSVSAREKDRAERFAAEYGAQKAFGSYEEMVADPELDAVYIAVPHSHHKEMSILAMRHGKHVLCEKPFAINARETEEMIRVAREENVFLMEAFWTKFLPTVRKIREWIQDGRLGKVLYINAKFCYEDPGREKLRLFDLNLGGGALLDVGIYPIAFGSFILGEQPSGVQSSCILGPTGVDEVNSVLVQYPQGTIAEYASAICMDFEERVVIIGEKARVDLLKYWRSERVELTDAQGNVLEVFDCPHPVNGYEYEAAEVNECIRQGKLESGHHPLEDTLTIMRLLDQIRGQWNYRYPQD